MIHSLRPRAGATAEIVARHSRFIALLERTPTEHDARAFIDQARAAYPDARHHCSAFVVSNPGQHDIEHSNDDGEPAGTAGRPMLEVLRGHDLGQVTVVVVRYFGGVLLGTGGLVRAYTDAVREVLAGLPILRVETLHGLRVETDHATAGALEGALQAAGLVPVERAYAADGVVWQLAVADASVASQQVASLSSGRARVTETGSLESEVTHGTL